MRKLGFKKLFGLIFAALAVLGCGDSDYERARSVTSTIRGEAMAPAAPAAKVARFQPDASEASPQGEATKLATAGRKIIYNARIELVTEDLSQLDASLSALITSSKAYVADSDRTGSAGATRHGTWKVRVPVDLYDAFVKDAVKLGELVSIKADSQDVSEEFFDLEAREKAKKVEEDRLLKHLTDSTGKLEEILTVERELSRVRSEIERMQGRLRSLGNLSSLATVTINASEIKGYVPPQAPTLGTRLARTFYNSLETLQQFGEAVLIAIVAVAPWLPLIAIGVGIVVWIVRRWIVPLMVNRPIVPSTPVQVRG